MNIAGFIVRPMYWLAGKILSIWARPGAQPELPQELLADQGTVICYVLEAGGLADTLVLEQVCASHGLPSPTEAFEFCDLHERRRLVVLRHMEGFIFRRPSKSS